MKRKKHTPQQILEKLRSSDVELSRELYTSLNGNFNP
jgi:hypothetical protein